MAGKAVVKGKSKAVKAASSSFATAKTPDIPILTASLFAAIAIVYLALSGGAMYIPNDRLIPFSLSVQNLPFGLVTYLFVHIGIIHLASNVINLVIFAYLAEKSLSVKDGAAVFLLSGAFAGLVYLALNPYSALAGASAGITGLMAASALSDPKRAIIALIALPFIVQFAVIPTATSISNFKSDALRSSVQLSIMQAETLIAQNRSTEARQILLGAQQQADALAVQEQGREREDTTQSDFLVHVAGAFIGAAYVLTFRKDAVIRSFDWIYAVRNKYF